MYRGKLLLTFRDFEQHVCNEIRQGISSAYCLCTKLVAMEQQH